METAAAFLAISALVIVTPGQDTVLTVRNTLLAGRAGLLPQFVPSGPLAFATMLGLGLVSCCMTGAWLSAYAFVVGRAGDVAARPVTRRALEAVAGTVLVAFGIRLASQRR